MIEPSSRIIDVFGVLQASCDAMRGVRMQECALPGDVTGVSECARF